MVPARRLESRQPHHRESRPSLHLEFSVHGSAQPGLRLQFANATARLPWARRFFPLGPPTPLEKLRAAFGCLLYSDEQNCPALRIRPDLLRSGRNHHPVHQSAVSLCAERLASDARQRHARIYSFEWSGRPASAAVARRGPWSRRLHRRPPPWLRIRTAMESGPSARAHSELVL